MADLNPEGRKDNAAQPLGDQKGIQSDSATRKSGERAASRDGGPPSRQDGFMDREGDPAEGKRH